MQMYTRKFVYSNMRVYAHAYSNTDFLFVYSNYSNICPRTSYYYYSSTNIDFSSIIINFSWRCLEHCDTKTVHPQ